jgi:hypothetical protein
MIRGGAATKMFQKNFLSDCVGACVPVTKAPNKKDYRNRMAEPPKCDFLVAGSTIVGPRGGPFACGGRRVRDCQNA